MTRYEHSQIGYVIIWCLLGTAILLAMMGSLAQTSPNAFLTTGAILVISAIVFYKLTIKIDDGSLRAWLGPGIRCKRVSLDEIAGCEPIRIRWWDGWGIHLTRYGWLYNVSGWYAVAIRLRDGRKFALGTDDPDGLTEVIRHFASAK